jgi:hypothetical protein
MELVAILMRPAVVIAANWLCPNLPRNSCLLHGFPLGRLVSFETLCLPTLRDHPATRVARRHKQDEWLLVIGHANAKRPDLFQWFHTIRKWSVTPKWQDKMRKNPLSQTTVTNVGYKRPATEVQAM